MAEAWKESLKRIKRGEEHERELRQEKDPQTLYNMAAWKGTDLWLQMGEYAEALYTLGDSNGPLRVLESRHHLFQVCGLPYRKEAIEAYEKENG